MRLRGVVRLTAPSSLLPGSCTNAANRHDNEETDDERQRSLFKHLPRAPFRIRRCTARPDGGRALGVRLLDGTGS